jgi:hypothetical protein
MSDDSQAIQNATIAPDAGALLINFTTRRPAKPVFTVWNKVSNDQNTDMVAVNQIAFALETSTPTTNHAKRIAGLPQGVPLWLRIDAQAEDLPFGDPRGPSSFVCSTGTLKRVCSVKIVSLEVLNSGDSGGGASMLFQFQVYNGSSSVGESLINLQQTQIDSIDNGTFVREVVGTFTIDNAPDVIVPYLGSLHFKGSGTIGVRIPDVLPDRADSGSNEEAEFADSMARATLPTQLGDTTSSALIMGTGLLVPSITATLDIETIVSNPANISLVMERPPGIPPILKVG